MPSEASVWYSDTSRSAMRSAARCPHGIAAPVGPVQDGVAVPPGPPEALSTISVGIGCDGRRMLSEAAVEIALVAGSGLDAPETPPVQVVGRTFPVTVEPGATPTVS